MDAQALLVTLGCIASTQACLKKKESDPQYLKEKIKSLYPKSVNKKGDKKILVKSDELESTHKENNVTEQKLENKKSKVTEESKVINEKNKELLNSDDFHAIVEVKVANTKKKFFFKHVDKVVNGEKYKCKIGYNENNKIVVVRYLWVGSASTPSASDSKTNKDLAEFFELS